MIRIPVIITDLAIGAWKIIEGFGGWSVAKHSPAAGTLQIANLPDFAIGLLLVISGLFLLWPILRGTGR